VLAAALLGAVAFVVGQSLAGLPMNIAQFIGGEIVRRGGYSPGLAGPIGWGVHLGVATSYAALYGAIVVAPFFPKERTARWGAALGLALALGWLTTLVTAPAIAITIGLLSGSGLPSRACRPWFEDVAGCGRGHSAPCRAGGGRGATGVISLHVAPDGQAAWTGWGAPNSAQRPLPHPLKRPRGL
jgi:hypothetical protein